MRAALTAKPHPAVRLRLGVSGAQETAGNLAVQRLLGSRWIQAKLAISQPNDSYEQEADRVADQVLSSSSAPSIRRSSITVRQWMPAAKAPPESTFRARKYPATRLVPVDGRILGWRSARRRPAARTVGARLVRAAFGQDFREVRVHTGERAADAARAIHARAFTTGPDIVFGNGQYRPETRDGQRLLAHELTHRCNSATAARR